MEKLIPSGSTIALFCLVTAFAVSACSTTGLQRSDDIQSKMESVDNDIAAIVEQIEAVGSSLDELTRRGQSDLEGAFNQFSDDASKIEDMQQRFSRHAAEMEESGEAYFEAWESDSEEYDNPEIRQRSEERRAELGETFDKIAENNVGVKEAFRAYVSDINEIERFLSNDLTGDGINSIKPIADEVVNNGSQLRSELQSLQSAIEEARRQMRRT